MCSDMVELSVGSILSVTDGVNDGVDNGVDPVDNGVVGDSLVGLNVGFEPLDVSTEGVSGVLVGDPVGVSVDGGDSGVSTDEVGDSGCGVPPEVELFPSSLGFDGVSTPGDVGTSSVSPVPSGVTAVDVGTSTVSPVPSGVRCSCTGRRSSSVCQSDVTAT